MRSFGLLLLGLLYVAEVYSYYTPCANTCLFEASGTVLSNMNLRYYKGNSVDDYVEIPVGDAEKLLELIDADKPTVIYIPDDGADVNHESTLAITEAYINAQTSNYLVLEWSNVWSNIMPGYTSASLEPVGSTLAELIADLIADDTFKFSKMTLIGHGRGAHVAGHAGLYTEFDFPRIVALDPTSDAGLKSKAAKSVIVIHTDIGGKGSARQQFGVQPQIGTADFYPNKGEAPQPGCATGWFSDSTCSHFRSIYLYAESIHDNTAFLSLRCANEDSFVDGLCPRASAEYMGAGTPDSAIGKYYLSTGSESPFSLGEEGTIYKRSSA